MLAYFQPYILRYTALTQLAQSGCDAFTLARIAGCSSITITQRYIHPQADAIERGFAPLVLAPEKSKSTGPNGVAHSPFATVSSSLPTREPCSR